MANENIFDQLRANAGSADLSRNQNWFFLIAGSFNERNNSAEDFPTMKKLIAEAPSNCHFYLERIEDDADAPGAGVRGAAWLILDHLARVAGAR